jgi:hypothetical protein
MIGASGASSAELIGSLLVVVAVMPVMTQIETNLVASRFYLRQGSMSFMVGDKGRVG